MQSLAYCGIILDAAAPTKGAPKLMDFPALAFLNKASALFANASRLRQILVPNGDAPPHAFGLCQT